MATRYPPGSYRLLDLGCGNARRLSLRPCAPCPTPDTTFPPPRCARHSDHLVSRFLPRGPAPADFQMPFVATMGALKSFSPVMVHHLSSRDKQSFQGGTIPSRRAVCLPNGGHFQEPDRDRQLPAQLLLDPPDWRTLSETNLASVEEHIRTRDFGVECRHPRNGDRGRVPTIRTS